MANMTVPAEWKLKQLPNFNSRPGPVLIAVMDGIGLAQPDDGNAVHLARTPVLDRLMQDYPHLSLKAHGTSVGLPSNADMGNSEVGHNAIGAGRVFDQGAKLVNTAIETGSLFSGEVWQRMIKRCVNDKKTLHLIGLLSDGNVHSHIDHLFSMIREAAGAGVQSLRVHPLLDGRDVGETSALDYIIPLEKVLKEINSDSEYSYAIASGGGRMLVTMDRYGADWRIVERGWKTHVLGQGRTFSSAEEAISTYRREDPDVTDQFTPEFVIVNDKSKPVGPIEDGDSVIFFNFRGDRALEISLAFEEKNFSHFDRQRLPDVLYAGMMEYDGDLKIPKTYLIPPPSIERTMGEYLARNGITQFACSETQKYGHVTFFWNGNRGGKFSEEYETYVEIPSDQIPFEQRPWMKSAQITDEVIGAIKSGKYRQIRLNYPNGDMVGHTGHLEATIAGVKSVDLGLERLLEEITDAQGIALITADHGNADEMYVRDKKKGGFKLEPDGRPVKCVSHSLNPVPFIIYDPGFNGEYELRQDMKDPGLGNIAATALNLMGFQAPKDYLESLVQMK
jgi:2,3-bisphosphoglycerate-independent phosphoglycerate mutase